MKIKIIEMVPLSPLSFIMFVFRLEYFILNCLYTRQETADNAQRTVDIILIFICVVQKQMSLQVSI